MEMLEAVCPNGHRLQVPLEHAGMKLRCPAPGCGVIFQLSASSPTGATNPVSPATSGTGLPSTAPAPASTPAPAPQPQSSQTYGTAPLGPAPAAATNDGGRWSGTEAAPSGSSVSAPLINAPMRGFGARAANLTGSGLLAGAQTLVMLGLVLVLTARGCDGLGSRNVARLKAKAALEEQQVSAPHEEAIAGYQAEQADEKLNDKARTDLDKRIADERTALSKAQAQFRKTKAENDNAAEAAMTSNIIWGYWREMLFVAGTILFSLGLMAVAFVSQGIERYLCLALVAIIVFSVYVGGAAWFSSIIGGLAGIVPGRL